MKILDLIKSVGSPQPTFVSGVLDNTRKLFDNRISNNHCVNTPDWRETISVKRQPQAVVHNTYNLHLNYNM